MHWIQTIREHLKLSQAELAHYLGLSVHMIISVENDRRQLPFDSLHAAISLFNAVKDSRTRGNVDGPPLKAANRTRHVERLHGQCCRRLDRCTRKLNEMQKAYTSACLRLNTYQMLAETLTPAQHKDDRARLLWTQQKIKEAMQARDNNITAQHFLTAEIAGLKSKMLVLEECLF